MAPLMTTCFARGLSRKMALLLSAAMWVVDPVSRPCVVFLIAVWSLFSAEPTMLEPGKTLERQFASGESHEYRFALDQGQYARINLFQRSINVAVECFGPDGKLRFQQDSHRIDDTEVAELIGDATGTYRLRVTAPDPNAPLGRYNITLAGVEPAAERHETRIAAARAYAQAGKLAKLTGRENLLKIIQSLELAAENWRTAHDLFEEARTLLITGLYYTQYGDPQKALDYETRAMVVAQASGNRRIEGWSYVDYALVVNFVGDKKKAIEYTDRGLPMLREAGDRAGEAAALDNLGRAYLQTGEGAKAIRYFEESMRIYEEIQDRGMVSQVVGNLGVTYDNLGEYQRALGYHQQKLALARELEIPGAEALALNNIASCYSGLGEYQKALDGYTSTLEIARKFDNRRQAAIALHNIAWVYGSLGEPRRALKFYQDALDVLRSMTDQWAMGNTLNNIAATYAELGEFSNALRLHNEALTNRRAVSDASGEAKSLDNIGKAYSKLGEREKARDHFERALAIQRKAGEPKPLAETLRDLGGFYMDGRDYLRAGNYLDEALAISRVTQDRRGEAEALGRLARLERDRSDFAAAHRRADEALAAFEALRRSVVSPSLRASFFTLAREVQEIDIESLVRLNAEHPGEKFDRAALVASERARARSLLEMLGESGRAIRHGVDAALLARERQLEQLISAKAENQVRLLSREHTPADAAAAAKELDGLTTELEQVQGRIRETSPQYTALMQPVPLDVNDIQAKVLDTDTVMIEYALGTRNSFLWVVTRSSLDIFELPSRGEIEPTARRVYDLLTARNQKIENESPAARATRIRRADEAFGPAAAKASAMLLAPAAARIAGKRLLIVAEGVLQYLPFASLPEPDNSAVPLIMNHEVITAPSASVVAVLRQETAGRKPVEKAVAIFADPVFSAGDARIVARDAHRSADDLGGQEFVRLRFSRAEAEEIARLAAPGATLKALDFDASRDTVLKPELGQYRILHFATHSLLNNEHPELSGVVLSLVDRSGRPQNGFLRLYDVYNLRLASDLVVLSACQTALGGEITGEGLIGLTRGFLYAGTPRIVATLWEVDDRTTAELMKRFYEGVLARVDRPAAALRSAQIAMWKNRGWDAPYYWAAFTLQGEWR
jgi:CHAT domain-containing protein/Tfp pilus assembly protein PilF